MQRTRPLSGVHIPLWEVRFRGRYRGQSGHGILHRICPLMIQSGHKKDLDPFKLALGCLSTPVPDQQQRWHESWWYRIVEQRCLPARRGA
jgi:hypothetical protein